jgi:hypothetical protein
MAIDRTGCDLLCREPISEELHKLRDRACHILVSVVKGNVSGPVDPAVDPAQLLGFLGVRERVRGHPRGDGVGSYDHKQRARCDDGDKPATHRSTLCDRCYSR